MNLEKLSQGRRALLLASIVVAVSVVLLLFVEGALRIRHTIKYGGIWGVEEGFYKDRDIGLRVLKADSTIGPITINSAGFRGPEIQMPKPQKTIRLAFLGASAVYSAEVSGNDKVWPHLVTEALQQHWPNVRFDYINGGVPGYGVRHSRRNLELKVKQFDPDVVFVYHAHNDLSGNSYRLAEERGFIEMRTEQALSWLSNYSLLSYLVEKNLLVLRRQAQANDIVGKMEFDADSLVPQFRSDLVRLVKTGQNVAERVVLITMSERLRRNQTPQEQREAAVTLLYYMPYMSVRSILDGIGAYNDVVREVAVELNTILIDTETAIPGDGKHFKDSVHLTDQGSRVMAAYLSNGLIASPEFKALVQNKISASSEQS